MKNRLLGPIFENIFNENGREANFGGIFLENSIEAENQAKNIKNKGKNDIIFSI